jgi:hypothetical protein
MVSIVERPQGHKVIDQAIAAQIESSFAIDLGDSAVVHFLSHSLVTGDVVYINSDIDEYNGFNEVEQIDFNYFYIKQSGDYVLFSQAVDIDYYQTQEHDWSAIFLPIIYKISNNRWPVNSVDTARSVSSAADDNGFTDLTLSGVVRASINALEFVEISGASNDDLNGVWQIVEVISTSRLVLSLPYDAANSFSGATVQYYYNNYQVKVKIYAGLNATSPWQTRKPYEEMAELSLTPDEDNLVMFSVSDYIQSKVSIKNNLTLFSLPLNLDAFTGFYISTAESYDDSDNYSLFTTQSDFTNDTFEGYAVAGKLPFKNLYAGDYADYVYTSGSPARWLTVFDRLLAVEGYFFDVSFIKNIIGTFFLRYTKYLTSDYGIVEDVNYTDQGIGVYRLPIEVNSAYESYCIQVFRSASAGFVPAVMDAIDTWTNVDTGGIAWTLDGAIPHIDTDLLGLGNVSDNWHTDYAFEAGRIYDFNYSFDNPNGCTTFFIEIVDVSNNVLITQSFFSTSSGTFSFLAPSGAAGINIRLSSPCSCGAATPGFCDNRILVFTNETASSGAADAFAITEEICIDILEVCEVEGGFTPEGRRLTEDGGFRLLE